MYDEKHRFHVLSIIPETENWREQKGLREEMLCDLCEQRFSKWERYASLVLQGGTPLTARNEGDLWHVSGINYAQFKLFQLSILWRASVSRLRFFENVSLGIHEERIRQLLIANDPGEASKYGCVMFGLKFEGNVAKDLIVQPGRLRLGGHNAYRFVFGGFMWAYIVSNHNPPPVLQKVLLQTSGSAIFLVKDAATAENIVNFGKELIRLGRM